MTFQTNSTFDLIVSNPIYSYSQKDKISKNVLNYEHIKPYSLMMVILYILQINLRFFKSNLNVDGNIFEINHIFYNEMIQLVSKYQNFSYKLIKDFLKKNRFMILQKMYKID